jgi:ubiquinone/menaquinone biosynthesis C-methylase UbiE
MAYDQLAPFYHLLELSAFGRALHRCRTRFIGSIEAQQIQGPVLILGDGDGRFLEEWMERYPDSSVDSLDFSAGMIRISKRRLDRWVSRGEGRSLQKVKWLLADALNWEFPVEHYSVVVTHFFLDSFDPEASMHLIPSIAGAVKPGGHWLCSDFQIPDSGAKWARYRAKVWVALLYACFQAMTETHTNRLTDPRQMMRQSGMGLIEEETSQWGLLRTEIWRKQAT